MLANGAAAPASAQVKAGQNAVGIAVAANLQGVIACATGNAEFLLNVTGLAGSTTYIVYFVAEDAAAHLQALPVMVAITTSTMPTDTSAMPSDTSAMAVGG